MPYEPWHPFIAGEAYGRQFVVDVISARLESGDVRATEWKEKSELEAIRSCHHEQIVFKPTTGWGASPMNKNAWKTIDGHDIG